MPGATKDFGKTAKLLCPCYYCAFFLYLRAGNQGIKSPQNEDIH